jgi:nuclear export mediator factor NEMF
VPYSQIVKKDDVWEVKGRKNFLPPSMLVLGYAVLWTTEDEDTMERHVRPVLAAAAATEDFPVGEQPPKVVLDDVEEDKYHLEEYGIASESSSSSAEEDTSSRIETVSSTTKQFFSAKQRREAKKGKTPEESTTPLPLPVPATKQKAVPPARGKKGKMKKIKARYADQSDEERELVQKLLGTKVDTSKQAEEIAQTTAGPMDQKTVAPTPKPEVKPPQRPSAANEHLEAFPLSTSPD